MSTIETMTIKELVALHNEHVGADDQIKTFKGRKDDLIATVAQVMRKARGKTIREVAEALLIEVAETNADGHKIGHPYDYVLEQVLAEFPEANTTAKCLRWYNTKLNSDANVKMPIRPRKKTAKAKIEETSEKTSETPILDAIVEEFEDADPIA